VTLNCPECDSSCQIDILPSDDAEHIDEPIDYSQKPPAGGDHNPCWYDYGIHETEVPDERWVHNLEHGAIVLLYNCPEGCASEVEALAAKAEELGEWVLMSPYSEMEWRFAAIAWEHRMLMGCLDVDAIEQFYHKYVDQGPESVSSDPPESCMD
jgi:hypothetical protein